MPLSADISTALHLLGHVQERVEDCDDPKLQMHTTQDLKSLISLLEDPVFRSIVTIQDSLIELNSQLGQHPSILPGDFDINISGQLDLSVPNTLAQPLGQNMYQDLYQDSSELEDQRVPVAPLVHSSSEDTSAQVTSPSLVSEVMGMPPITTPTYAKEFKKVIEAAARGRQICTVQLYKPEGTSLGFSVVGLRSKDKGELGIFLQEIQPNGIAGCDGRLLEGDQILAIDGQPLDSNISHEQAISILQKARGLVELVVARSTQDVGSSLPTDELSGGSVSTAAAGAAAASVVAAGAPAAGASSTHHQSGSDKEQSVSVSSVVTPQPTPKSSQPPSTASAATPTPTQTPTPTPTSTPVPGGLVIERSPSAVSDASKSGSDMVLNTEWAQVEVINLINDGSGLGFGIIGGRSTGVVVKTILPGGVADRDNRLQSGDHILQIGDVNLRGMGSEQVAAVLRQSGTHVRLVVARPVEPTSPDYQALGSHAPIVPTKILGDPDELDRHLVHSVPETYNIRHVQGESTYDNGYMYSQESDMEMHARPSLIMDVVRNPMPIGTMPVIPAAPVPVQMSELPVLTMDTIDVNSLPEMERFTVELKKDIYGLGITIAGYVCEKEELSGIFVKSISEGSAADLSNKIQINDRIVEVDGHSLQGYSNHQAVEVLRSTGQTVLLCLERYLRGPKFEQLQQAIAASELRLPQPSSPSITSLPSFPISADGETTTEIEPEGESHTTVDSAVLQEGEREKEDDYLDDATNVEALLSDPSSELTPQIRAAIKSKWQKIVGPDTEIVVAQLKKFAEGSGLGISLEGTVDVENGQEVRPHHYIRSILPEGPVGQNGTLRSGDELLEVNGYRLLGINHMEVVSVLKELPIHVRMVCGRNIASQDPLCPIDTAQHQAAFQTRSILGGSLQNLLPTMDRLVKAKSDGSLASTTTTATVTDASLNKMKSRSLEPLTGLAMWSSEPQIIELVKGERGLGFSILDYQDPMNPNETVIVIRSLVPGGVAQVDGQLIPGDRLLFVNDIALENATLDQAVQALKGAPKGTVRIGVAKPLPIPDSIVQRVTPVCTVRRSRSLPNGSETTDRAAEIEDFLSSRSGVTELSMDKQEIEEDEDEDHWKDASPITPVCSPTRKAAQRPLEIEAIIVKPDLESTKARVSEDRLVPETSIASEKSVVTVAEVTKSVEPVAPRVKLKEEERTAAEKIEAEESIRDIEEQPQGRLREKRKTLRRHSSLESEGRTSTSRETLADKSDTSSEKGARRKVLPDKERKKSRRRQEDSRKNLSFDEDDDRQDPEEASSSRRLKEIRKSLREQECIERVTEFLTKHSILDYSEPATTEVVEDRGFERLSYPDAASSLEPVQRVSETYPEPFPTFEEIPTRKKQVAEETKSAASVGERVTLSDSSFLSKLDQGKRQRKQESVEKITEQEVPSSKGRRFAEQLEQEVPSMAPWSMEPQRNLAESTREVDARRIGSEARLSKDHRATDRTPTELDIDVRIIERPDELESFPECTSPEDVRIVSPDSANRIKRLDVLPETVDAPEPAKLSIPDLQSGVRSIDRPCTLPEVTEKIQASVESSPPDVVTTAKIVDKSSGTSKPAGRPEKLPATPDNVQPLSKQSTPDTEVQEIPKKPRPSLRKKKDPFSRESSRESLDEVTRKEVRIQDDVQEIFFEDASEQITGFLPEVQLVKARIITAEEAVAGLLEEPAAVIEIHSPPEIVQVKEVGRSKAAVRAPSPEVIDAAQLQLPALAKSTSENALIATESEEDNKVSQRNIKPEILLDLSKVAQKTDEPEADEEDIREKDGKRMLTRTGSEGSKRTQLTSAQRLADRRSFKVGSLAMPGEPELMTLPETARKEEAKEEKKTEEDGVEARLKEPEKKEPLLRSGKDKGEDRSLSPSQLKDEEPSRVLWDSTSAECDSPRHPDKCLQQQRALSIEEDSFVRSEGDASLISKEHSLEYQSQTLETQAIGAISSSSLDNLLSTIPESWTREVYEESLDEYEQFSFKETQYSPKEKREAETQTEQETKSTQCSPEEGLVSGSPAVSTGSPYIRRGFYQSPRREVQTQTQGESKSVQCSLEDLTELDQISSRLPSVVDVSTESPSRSERAQVQESKSVQCIPEDICSSSTKSFTAPKSPGQEKPRSPRREVEVQTYQESKAVQCNDDELLSLESDRGIGFSAGRLSERGQSEESHKSESSPTSSCGSPRRFPTVVFVEGRSDMTVTHREHDGNVAWAKHWGPERLVEIYREPKTSLGLSIVGGKVDLHNGSAGKSSNISGIFIKNVLPNSPAGRTGELKVGDRIIEVDGVDLRHSTHERAVEVIQAAGNPVCLLVQSLVHLSPEAESNAQEEDRGPKQAGRPRLPTSGVAPGTPTASFRHKPPPVSPARSITPEVIQGGLDDGDKQSSSRSDFRRQSTKGSDGGTSGARRSSMKKSVRKKAPSPPSNPGILREVSEEREDNAQKKDSTPKPKYSSEESSDEEDVREMEGNVYTKGGMEISRKSAGNVKRTKEEIEADPEKEDEFGYTAKKIQKKYHNFGNTVLMVKVEKDRRGLGISLSGHKDRNRMAVFVCGLNPKGAAYKGGGLQIGDEILEVNGTVLQGRCHLNASALIKGMAGTCFKIIVVRRKTGVENLAVKPIVQFPPSLEDGDQFSQYKGVRNVPVKKGTYGLGIMIIEGKHAEVGQGIFVSDIQEGSAAEQAGLQVGDLILAVNMDNLLGSTYDEATSLLKKAEGVVTLTVCNPNQSKLEQEEKEKEKGGGGAGGDAAAAKVEKAAPKEPEKPKEPEPPQDPKDCKINVGRETSIEFQKEKDKGIGFTIAGGSDTPMSGVFILEVFPDGAAGKDGRLKAGDQILDMCHENFKSIEHDKAHACVLKATGTITMVVLREEKAPEEVEVELQKKSGKGAGLCLTGFKCGKGAYVSDLLPGGSAIESGKICKGDQVVAIGGQDMREAPVEDIAVHVKVSNPVQLKLARYKAAKQ